MRDEAGQAAARRDAVSRHTARPTASTYVSAPQLLAHSPHWRHVVPCIYVGVLRSRFSQRDKDGVCGGVEYGFMSCSRRREVAVDYGREAYLFECTTGMVTRGASLAWLSFYPEEEEVLLPPCTAMEVIAPLHTDADNCTVVKILVVSAARPAAASAWRARE